MTSKYIPVSEVKNRKCPLSQKRCIAPDCALWRGGMHQLEYVPGRGPVRLVAGACQLAYRGGLNG